MIKERIDYAIKDEYDLSLISDECKDILVRKNSGESFAQIARDSGCSQQTIRAKAKFAVDILQNRIKNGEVTRKRIDYAIKDEYDLSLIPDECKDILVRKNSGESFTQIARDLGCSRQVIQAKAKSAIEKLQKEEKRQSTNKSARKADYTLKDEYDLSLISDECRYILQQKNEGKSLVKIAEELGQPESTVQYKAKSALDTLQGKESSQKICQNCGKSFHANSNNAKYCDDCKNGKVYMPGHKDEVYGELKVDAVYRHQGRLYAECTCSCGEKCETRYDSLRDGRVVSCGHVAEKNLFTQSDLAGKTNQYGVKALYQKEERDGTCYVWRCLCTCGKEFDVATNDFQYRKSCGHLHEEARKNNMKMAQKVFYEYAKDGTNALIITSKIPRNNKSGFKGVKWDGERGRWYAEIIFKGKKYYLGRYYNVEDAAEVRKIAEEHTHKDFLKWFSEEFPLLYRRIDDKVEESEVEDIKRIREIRSRNRKNREWILEYNGVEKTLVEWCKELGMDYDCIRNRIKILGWSVKKAFETPVRQRTGQSNKEN